MFAQLLLLMINLQREVTHQTVAWKVVDISEIVTFNHTCTNYLIQISGEENSDDSRTSVLERSF